MQNNGTIPNVSTVFRELVKISSTNPRLNTQNQNDNFRPANKYDYGNNTYNSNNENNWQSSFPSSIAENDRQQRHQALMGRLRNSVQENRQLLGVKENPIQRINNPSYNYDRPQIQVSSFGSNNIYSQNEFGGFGNRMGESREKGAKWAPPKIKYRHIEDLQQKSSVSIQNNQLRRSSATNNKRQGTHKETNLKEQFYEQNPLNNSQSQNNKQNYQHRLSNRANQSQEINTNDKQLSNQDQDQQQQNINKLSIVSQKPSKYNQNLQSYYDICRKPIKPSLMTGMAGKNQEKNTTSQKFMRKQVPKVEGINLEKAMKILSLDD